MTREVDALRTAGDLLKRAQKIKADAERLLADIEHSLAMPRSMSLEDYFAGLALSAVIPGDPGDVARRAYALAGAMLAVKAARDADRLDAAAAEDAPPDDDVNF